MGKQPTINPKIPKYWNTVLLNRPLINMLVIVAFTLLLWEMFSLDTFTTSKGLQLRYLYISRGIFGGIIVSGYAFWYIYMYHQSFKTELARTEEYYKMIIDNSDYAIISIDNHCKISFWNVGATKLFGWTDEEIIGKPMSLIWPSHTMTNKRMIDNLLNKKDNDYYESLYVTKDGKQIKLGFSQYTYFDSNGKVQNWSQILRNVTEQEIRESQMRESEKLATIGHMAAGIAHEIGNPLTSISSLAQLTKRKSNDPIVVQNLEKIITHIFRITKIVREMVDFSRPSKARVQIVNVNTIIRSAVGMFRFDSRTKNTEFHLDLEDLLPEIHADSDQIHQVILNILINAVDANGKDGKNVTIKTYKKDTRLYIEISDEGIGIPDDIKVKIFEPFFTTKEVGKGTGLGLSVSHGIIRNLNGLIYVKNNEDKGSKFVIELPLTEKK